MSLKKFLLFILSCNVKRSTFPSIQEGDSIPKIIHQTYHRKELPPELEINIKKICDLNPGWEYRRYDDADIIYFIKENYPPHVLNYFMRIKQIYGAARADLFRYLLIYRCGGVYLDIKSSSTKPLDDVIKIDDRYLLSYWDNKTDGAFKGWGLHQELNDIVGGEFQQWYIAAAPGHPFLKAVIENVFYNIDKYNPGLHGEGKYGVLRLTGPVARVFKTLCQPIVIARYGPPVCPQNESPVATA